MLNHRLVILGLFLGGAAQAAPVTFDLTGTITQAAALPGGAPQPTVGEQIPIVITIDDAYPANVPGGGVYSSIIGGNQVITSAVFAGISADGPFQTVTVTPGSSITFNTGSQQTSFGFNLALSGAVAGALPTTALPLALSASEFASGTFSVTELFSPTVEGFSGVIDGLAGSVTTVPEPATWALLAMGLASLAWFRTRMGRAC